MKKRLRIQDLKIQSFITELDSALAKTAKGGDETTIPAETMISCLSSPPIGYPVYPQQQQSLFPYNGSAECTKITTTTTTTMHH